MTLEIARRLGQDGVTWETVVVDESTNGGSQPVGCVLARDAPFDIRQDAAASGPLWDALYDNFWDLNPLGAIPAGLGLTFALDGSSSLVVPTESGIWTLSYLATRAGDDDWEGYFAVGGVGWNFPWIQPRIGTGIGTDASGQPWLASSMTAPLPAGTQLTHSVICENESAVNPYVCTQVYLSIVRLG